ncbi:co-chaperone YbbN [Leptolyngbya sp. FACHB-261]|uniref:thioredoxin family protein n=1 Tax=Leptolyngbya sp. FACHB-261 TaxID=2692806 RepID=UPI001682003D|nr:thioredoxin domain-containing protein [Leptolyngbya sp. FACHB-261]MBD2101157.1 thioredoxin [Leptolyngbya sp. FACHB-261]
MFLPVSDETFVQEVLAADLPVLVYFWAPWCGLCRMSNPLLTRFESEWGDQLKLVRINADENFRLANEYRLKTIPALMLFAEGKLVHRLSGFSDREDLRIALEELVAAKPVPIKIY